MEKEAVNSVPGVWCCWGGQEATSRTDEWFLRQDQFCQEAENTVDWGPQDSQEKGEEQAW